MKIRLCYVLVVHLATLKNWSLKSRKLWSQPKVLFSSVLFLCFWLVWRINFCSKLSVKLVEMVEIMDSTRHYFLVGLGGLRSPLTTVSKRCTFEPKTVFAQDAGLSTVYERPLIEVKERKISPAY